MADQINPLKSQIKSSILKRYAALQAKKARLKSKVVQLLEEDDDLERECVRLKNYILKGFNEKPGQQIVVNNLLVTTHSGAPRLVIDCIEELPEECVWSHTERRYNHSMIKTLLMQGVKTKGAHLEHELVLRVEPINTLQSANEE